MQFDMSPLAGLFTPAGGSLCGNFTCRMGFTLVIRAAGTYVTL